MFQAKPQEYHDRYTGAALTFGEHENGGSWLRVTVPVANEGEPVRVTTLHFRNGEIVRSDIHPLAGPDAGGETVPDDPALNFSHDAGEDHKHKKHPAHHAHSAHKRA